MHLDTQEELRTRGYGGNNPIEWILNGAVLAHSPKYGYRLRQIRGMQGDFV